MITTALIIGYLASVYFAYKGTQQFYRGERIDPTLVDVILVLMPIGNIAAGLSYRHMAPNSSTTNKYRKLFRLK